MTGTRPGCASVFLWMLVLAVALNVYFTVTYGRLKREQTELLETGVQTEATIERVSHTGLFDRGRVYARLDYMAGGDEYAVDVLIANRFYQFPTGRVKNGKTIVSVCYDPEDPARVAYAPAAKWAKVAFWLTVASLSFDGLFVLAMAHAYFAMRNSDWQYVSEAPS